MHTPDQAGMGRLYIVRVVGSARLLLTVAKRKTKPFNFVRVAHQAREAGLSRVILHLMMRATIATIKDPLPFPMSQSTCLQKIQILT